MKEDTDSAPEFVAMKGNAIRFTKDPEKALHFTQGMEESGVVHCSNIKNYLLIWVMVSKILKMV